MTAFKKTLPVTIVGLAFLTLVTVFGYTGHWDGTTTYVAIMGLIGLAGASGLYILASQWSNSTAWPHFIVGLAIVVAVVVLGIRNVFNQGQTLALFTLLLTGTGAAAVGVAVDAVKTP